MSISLHRSIQFLHTISKSQYKSSSSPFHSYLIPFTSFSSASKHAATLSPSTYASFEQHQYNKEQIMSDDKKYILGTYARFPQMFIRGEGCYLYDVDDIEYLDFYAGIAVNALGHAESDWLNTLGKQASKLTHTSNLYYSAPQTQLAKLLVTSCTSPTCCNNKENQNNSSESGNCFSKVFFCNSGTEANEGAIKFARKYAYHLTNSDYTTGKVNKKTKILAFTGSFHGRSVGAVSLTHKSAFREPFMPLMGDVEFVKYNDINALKQAMKDNVCAVFVEPVQGERGVFPATQEFIQAIRTECTKYNAIMVVDEVQCGVGRSGALWAHSAYGIQPDIMTLAKPLANGLPIGAILVNDKITQCIQPGDHGSTFSGNPLVTAAAYTVVNKIANPEFLESIKIKGKLLYQLLTEVKDRLKKSNNDVQITDIRSMNQQSLLVGVDLNIPAKDIIVEAGNKHRLLLISGGEKTLRLCPPLIIDDNQIRYAVSSIEKLLTGRKKTVV